MISSREVSRSWKSWLAASDAEVQSLVEEKEALKKITRKELEEIPEQAAQQGCTVEIKPSKLALTIKTGPNGGQSLEIKLTSKHQHRHQHLIKCEAPKNALKKFFGFSHAHVLT